jgi:hypothetical protein
MSPFAERVQEISDFFSRVDSGRLRIQDGVKEYRRIENRIMADWIAGKITASGKETLLDILREWREPHGENEFKC